MISLYPVRTAQSFYRAFLKDAVRLLRAVPRGLKLRWWSVLAVQLGTGFLETLSLVCISVFALSIATPEAVPDNFLLKPLLWLFPSLKSEILGSPRRIVALASLMMVVSIAMKCTAAVIASRACSAFAERAVMYISTETIRRYMARDYLWHMTPDSQEAVLKVINRHVLADYTSSLLLFYSNALICLTLFVSLSCLEPKLTFTAFAVFGTAALLLYAFFRKRLDREGANVLKAVTDENRILMAASRGIREIIIHRAQALAVQNFAQTLARGLKPRVVISYLGLMPQQILETLGFATMGAMVVGMLAMNLPMEEIVQTASLLMLTAWRILPAVNRCLVYSVRLRSNRPTAIAYFELWDRFQEEGGPPPPEPDPDFRFDGELSLRAASFRYPGAASDALRDVSLTIPKGARVGLVGPSGSGKSTLALILSGLAPPSGGEFLVDGKPLSPARREAYFKILGYVPQNPLVMDGTLAENVAFADWGGARDEARVRRALARAAADFAETDPRGLDMPLSSSSQSLSGGQIQRVAIARALYSDPQVLLFDEATSALDQASENLIRRTLHEAGEGVTTVVIAHRLTTVELCDVLYWLEGGRIAKSGPPSEIIPLYLRDAERKEAERAREGALAPDAPEGGDAGNGIPDQEARAERAAAETVESLAAREARTTLKGLNGLEGQPGPDGPDGPQGAGPGT
ncbi:MAG: ATP-binding cassette domain-containing protein [Deltaproteobacteria bacterium]|jgi:ABC-type multidrug transport system fused ATPase/permease subunit|nr:ATP-binding cassette domain-containing protein [Deltaproteobacteria bacterium]